MTTENLGNLIIKVNGPLEEEYAHKDYSLDNVSYDGTVSIHFVSKIDFDLSAELVDDKLPYAVIIHNLGDTISTRVPDSFEVQVLKDGYYQITTLILPTTDFVEFKLGYKIGSPVLDNIRTKIIAAEVNDGNVQFKILTYTRDETSGYYNYIWSEWNDVDLLTVLELVNESDTNVKEYTKDVFVYDVLYQCYINRSLELLNKYSGDSGFCTLDKLCKDSLGKYKNEIQIRDYLWMAINAIKYCLETNLFIKALKILNCVTTCMGICSDVKINNTKLTKGCGCGK